MADWQAPGCSTLAPFLIADDPEAIVVFAQQVFDAELLRPMLHRQDGSVWNAALHIGDSTLMVSGGQGMVMSGFVHVYVPDVDAAYARALDAGAHPMMPVEEQFYGDRAGGVTDRQGNTWWIATHVETLDDAALQAAARKHEERQGS